MSDDGYYCAGGAALCGNRGPGVGVRAMTKEKREKCRVCAATPTASFGGGKRYCDPCLKAEVARLKRWDDLCWHLGVGRWSQ